MADSTQACEHCRITALLARYYQAIDAGDLETLEREVLGPDATWEFVHRAGDSVVRDKAEGPEAVAAWFRATLGGDVTMSEGAVSHHATTHLVEIDGHTAITRSHLMAVDNRHLQIVASGTAYGEHLRTPAGWRIQRYVIDEYLTERDMAALAR